MPPTRKILKVIAWVTAGPCVIMFIAAGAIRVDEYLLRRNAEHFLADLRSLEMRKSTYNDARLVISRWQDNIHAQSPCQPNRCNVEIGIGDFYDHHWTFFSRHPQLQQIWRVLGGRPAMIYGYIRVQNGIVWGKGIRAIILSYSAEHQEGVELVGRIGSGPPGYISLLHPEYAVGPGHVTTGAFTIGAYAEFTPYADPADVERLMDIKFSCLTRWQSCQTVADIVPAAWNEITADKEKKAARNSVKLTCSSTVVRVLARESRRAVIGEVSAIWPGFKLHGDPESAEVKVRLKDDLKPCSFDFLVKLRDYSFSESLSVKRKLGDRYILFFRYPDSLYSDKDRACDLLPATKENMEAARRGVAEDLADHSDGF